MKILIHGKRPLLDERVQIRGTLAALHGLRILKEIGQPLALLLKLRDLELQGILPRAKHFVALPNRKGAIGKEEQGHDGNRADDARAQREAPVALQRRC